MLVIFTTFKLFSFKAIQLTQTLFIIVYTVVCSFILMTIGARYTYINYTEMQGAFLITIN